MSAEIIPFCAAPARRPRCGPTQATGRVIDATLAALIREREWTPERAVCWLYDNRICLSLAEAIDRIKRICA